MRRLILIAFLLFCHTAQASGQSGPLIVVLLPGTSLRDWRTADAPNLKSLMASGTIAVMNTRTARLPTDIKRETPESATLTLSAGARSIGEPNTSQFIAASTPVPGLALSAGTLYARRMGRRCSQDALVDLSWPSLLRDNQGQGHDICLGALSATLAAHGIPVHAGGGPYSRLVAVSNDGTALPASSVHDAAQGGLLVWDAGGKVDAADPIIAEAVHLVKSHQGELIVLSPFVNDNDYASGRRLAPVLVYNEGTPSGLLASPSTRRPGLVTSVDFAPSVAAYFQLDKTTFAIRPFGEVWGAQPLPDSVGKVTQLEEQAYRQAQGMQILPYLALALALWLLLATGLSLRGRLHDLCLLLPLATILALLVNGTALSAAVGICGFQLLLFLTASRFGVRSAILVALAVTTAVLLLDMVSGSHLMQSALLGYSAVEGARYYGIGNEAMGVFVGAVLVLARYWWPATHVGRLSLVIILAAISFLISAPQAGAKAGGLLVSSASFGTLVYGLWGGRWSVGVVMGLFLTTVIALASVAAGDAFLAQGHHSHLGEAVRRIQIGGFAETEDIITRKLLVEIRLAWHSAWAYLLWVALVCLSLIWKRGEHAAVPAEDKALRTAGIVAIACCLAFNDAGIVAAALCAIPLWADAAFRLTQKQPLETTFPGA